MPKYPIMQAWIHEESNFIFTGYKERLEDVLKEINIENYIIISETSQKRLGFRLRDLARKHKEITGTIYSVKCLSGLVTLGNIISSYASSEGIFKMLQMVRNYELEEWIEKYKTR
ncbi:hypothetical protein CSV80_17075 [Sporosarcina sp. P12(2017)]|uniref:hypothetical protein n=1 Tax=unclassified Sporosarcina TaxID=2647733 RepID=UPI000C1633A7|nr:MULTISPECIES: hypothetical protein [unclassified Sporosarcina]PIC55919.1 hypothetical protein CSV81_17095 [Sporosarcina sp. P10]PIC59253.1 hypothetical protein CSV80_17075 [Sporosarcina sp. P12(2017)]